MYRYLILLISLNVTQAHAALSWECGSIDNPYGPFDYTNSTHFYEKLPVVERLHFDGGIESLAKGITDTVGGDLDYTLRAFPNHHRALYTVVRYHTDPLANTRERMRYSADCYFQRALEFKPDDATVRLIYGIYLHKVNDREEAMRELNHAARLAPNSPEVHYNLGLVLLDMGKNERARHHAKIAYSAGYPLPGLQRKLQAAGSW